jgi:hypothetical protein
MRFLAGNGGGAHANGEKPPEAKPAAPALADKSSGKSG